MYIRAKVLASAKKESIKHISEDHFEITVKQKPAKNLANKRVIELIAEYLETSIKKIKIIKGHHGPNKLLFVQKE